MKFKIYFYHVVRVALGILLVVYSLYNVIKYTGFLNRLDIYFGNVTLFDIGFLEAIAPLVPFEEFLIGILLTLGISVRKVLVVTASLFGFFTLFLIDATRLDCALIHFMLFIIAVALLKKDHYNLTSFDYSKDIYQMTE